MVEVVAVVMVAKVAVVGVGESGVLWQARNVLLFESSLLNKEQTNGRADEKKKRGKNVQLEEIGCVLKWKTGIREEGG